MYIFITIVFIAELIIAFNLIVWILKADKKVRHANECVCAFNPLAEIFLQYMRCKVSTANESFNKIFVFIRKKQEQVLYKIILMSAIYLILFMFKVKAKKASKIYRLIGAIRDLALELTV